MAEHWSLEVVRGLEAGRVFALGSGEVVIGNAPDGPNGINLAGQESVGSPRKMSGRHASMESSSRGILIRDLESPGGTFVNRQRILPGQARPLEPGDVIQLGGVQLRLVGQTSKPQAPSTHQSAVPFAFVIEGGTTCRTWDDFLTFSSQRWDQIREELTSGRLAGFLTSIGRADLVPSPQTSGSADDRLDAWLGSLPTSKPAVPELDVHPTRLVIRATPGGGVIRKSVRVSNVGYRRLRSTARIEPPNALWLALDEEFLGRSFTTLEGTDLTVEVSIPATLPTPLTADLVIEGNGGSRRIPVILEAKPALAEPEAPATSSGLTLIELIGRQSPGARIATWGLSLLLIRILLGVAGGSIGNGPMVASGPDSPGLGGVALALGLIGGLTGSALAATRGGRLDALPGGIAGGFAGVIGATGLVAVCRSVEPMLGAWSSSIVVIGLLWAGLGASLAAVSTRFVKGNA